MEEERRGRRQREEKGKGKERKGENFYRHQTLSKTRLILQIQLIAMYPFQCPMSSQKYFLLFKMPHSTCGTKTMRTFKVCLSFGHVSIWRKKELLICTLSRREVLNPLRIQRSKKLDEGKYITSLFAKYLIDYLACTSIVNVSHRLQ